jgi:hypothetical protein
VPSIHCPSVDLSLQSPSSCLPQEGVSFFPATVLRLGFLVHWGKWPMCWQDRHPVPTSVRRPCDASAVNKFPRKATGGTHFSSWFPGFQSIAHWFQPKMRQSVMVAGVCGQEQRGRGQGKTDLLRTHAQRPTSSFHLPQLHHLPIA